LVTSILAGTMFSILCFSTRAHVVSVTKHRHQMSSPRHLERMEQVMPDVYALLRLRTRRVQRGTWARPPAGELPAHRRHLPPGQRPKGRILPQAAAGIPGPVPALLASTAAVVRSNFAGSVGGAPISVLRQYIEQQERPA
jgi:putative transposase